MLDWGGRGHLNSPLKDAGQDDKLLAPHDTEHQHLVPHGQSAVENNVPVLYWQRLAVLIADDIPEPLIGGVLIREQGLAGLETALQGGACGPLCRVVGVGQA